MRPLAGPDRVDRLARPRRGYRRPMRVFTRRNAVIGWAVTRIARKRFERRLNALAGNHTRRPWLALWTAVLTGAVAVAGALAARRAAGAA